MTDDMDMTLYDWWHTHDTTYTVIPNAGQIGVAPEPASCVTGSEDSTSCTAEVAQGGNLQLCVNHRTHPQNSAQTVRLERAVWASGADKLVACGPTRCNSFKPNVNTGEPWAKCLTMVNVTENGTVSYSIRVDPDTSYPATAPAPTMFTFTVRVVDGKS